MKKLKYLLLLLPILVLTGCSGGEGGGFDLVAFVKNPIVMVLIFIATLYLVFKGGKK